MVEEWFKNLLSESKEVQSKKVAFLAFVFSGVFYLGLDLLFQRILTQTWVTAFAVLAGVVTGGYLGGKAIEKEKP